MEDSVYLSVDGGGTKLQMLLYDRRLTPLGAGLAGSVNTNSTTPENSMSNVRSCLEQVFSTCRPAAIDRAYVVFVGPADVLRSELAQVAPIREYMPLSEPVAGLMAGAFWREGISALSGTGSDVFLCAGEHQPRALRQNFRTVVGGWGPLLGDQGSGAWVGQQAIRAAVSGMEGWTQPTLLMDLIRRDWKLGHDFDMVNVVHRSGAPFRQMASLTRLVAEAADRGDAVALGILRKAGELMAAQTLCLFRRWDIPEECRRLVCAGGTWKAHPAMFETFRERLLAQQPGLEIRWPLFEPILAGPAMVALESGITADAACALLARQYPEMKIAHPQVREEPWTTSSVNTS
jgi:N-acetylglucosamine kinase-like BadF-type ATPase